MATERDEGNPLVHVPGVSAADAEIPPAYSAEGVDLTQIRAMLRLTPAGRLQVLQDMIDFVAEAEGAGVPGKDR